MLMLSRVLTIVQIRTKTPSRHQFQTLKILLTTYPYPLTHKIHKFLTKTLTTKARNFHKNINKTSSHSKSAISNPSTSIP